jgi:hypothetical protein
MKQYIAEVSDANRVLNQRALRANTLAAAKHDAAITFIGSLRNIGCVLTILEHTEDDNGARVRPLAARLAADRRASDWVDYT